ncbi:MULTISPECIES: WD40/YVTN/BNR-like repeat-containing protein [Cupriavidus]
MKTAAAMRQRWLWIVALFLLASCHWGDGVMWEKVSDSFMKEQKPYGPGDFRIRGNDVISMRIAEPEITFKPMTESELADPGSAAVPSEPWMADASEMLNRQTVQILAGHMLGAKHRLFEEPAQDADWWISPDWRNIYLATGWMDYHTPKVEGQNVRQISRLFKSTDSGQHWQQLAWPEHRNITFLRFLDTERGYLIGWGPRIWRTADGGAHWTEIPVPDLARDPTDERKQFDLVALGKDGVLRFAFFTPRYEDQQNLSLVYALRWGEDTPTLAFRMPGHTIVDIDDHLGHLYVLSWKGPPSAVTSEAAPRRSVVSHWGIQAIEPLHEFGPGLKGYALYMMPNGGLLLDGEDESGAMPTNVTAASYDGGKRWKVEREGRAQGGYYDSTTGTRWQVRGYTLYKRDIR